jgi:hypothetical protein
MKISASVCVFPLELFFLEPQDLDQCFPTFFLGGTDKIIFPGPRNPWVPTYVNVYTPENKGAIARALKLLQFNQLLYKNSRVISSDYLEFFVVF